MQKNLFSQICLLFIPFLLKAQSGGDLDRIFNSLPHGTKYSIIVVDAGNEQILYERNPRLPLKPASCLKVFTTGIPLLYLGKDFRIAASVYFNRANIKNGILNDNIYLKGFGNALLTANDLTYLAKEIQNAGIKRISGSIIYDNTFFIKTAAMLNYTFALSPLNVPSVSPISINGNIIELAVTQTTSRLEIKSFPKSKYITVVSNLTFSGSRNKISAILQENPEGYKITIRGNITQDKDRKIYLFIKKPELLASLLLQEKLEDSGIKLNSMPQQGVLPEAGLNEISSSVPLADFIKEINKNSNNFLAETLKNIFDRFYSEKEKINNSGSSFYSFLKSNGISADNLFIVDGSGISGSSRLTAGSITDMLRLIYNNKKTFEVYKNSLSIAGNDGTLKERFSNSVVKNNFRGKTGYLNGISSICGYMQTASGKNIIIAVILNFKMKGIDFYRDIERAIIETVFSKN